MINGTDLTSPAQAADTPRTRTRRAKRLSEFVYGIITAMVALAPFVEYPDESAGYVVAIAIVGGAVAIWLAHAYSEMIGERATAGHSFGLSEAGRFLRQSLPIVAAGSLIAIPIMLSETGLWTVSMSLVLANALGLLSLALVGLAVGITEDSGAGKTALNALFAVSIGAFIILLERAVHHLG